MNSRHLSSLGNEKYILFSLYLNPLPLKLRRLENLIKTNFKLGLCAISIDQKDTRI